jgi:hypothetical protein
MPYSELRADAIQKTLRTLEARVSERFPDRGLAKVAGELRQVADSHVARLRDVEAPHYRLRFMVALVLLAGIAAIGFGIYQKIRILRAMPDEIYSFEGVEAIVNIALLVSAGVWFLLNLEARLKRERALVALHELRSIAHIIDMHQLTKDPASLVSDTQRTKSSPTRDLTAFELLRYLDYCTELLSLTGKLAALYMQKLRDPVIIAAANDIENLTSGFSQKIWQKIMLVEAEVRHAETLAAAKAPVSPVPQMQTSTLSNSQGDPSP